MIAILTSDVGGGVRLIKPVKTNTYTQTTTACLLWFRTKGLAGPRSAIGRALDSKVRGPGFDNRSGDILSFLLPLFQEGQLSVTGESMCTKYWLTA